MKGGNIFDSGPHFIFGCVSKMALIRVVPEPCVAHHEICVYIRIYFVTKHGQTKLKKKDHRMKK